MKFLSPEITLYIYKSTIWSCIEYCCNTWAGALVATWSCQTNYKNEYAGLLLLHLLLLLNPLAHSRNVARLNLFYSYYFGRCSSELSKLVPFHFYQGRSTPYSDRSHDFSVTIPRCCKYVYIDSFFPRRARLEPLNISRSLEWLNWDHEGFGFPPFLHVLSIIMNGIKVQNFSLMSSTVTK